MSLPLAIDAKPEDRSSLADTLTGSHILALLPADHFLVDLLAARRYQVETVAGPVALFETARRLQPDLLLLDLPPDCTWAYELSQRLKEDPGLQRVPILALSGGSRGEYLQLIRKLRVDDCLQKPFELDEFLARLERLLVRRRSAGAEDLLEDLVHFTHLMALVTDSAGHVLAVSPAAARFLGYAREDLVGARYTDLFSSTSAEDFQRMAHTVGSGRQVSGQRARLADRFGGERVVEIDAAPLPVPGSGVHIALVFRDISSRLRAEKEAEEYTRVLQEAVEERTRRLMETQNQLIMSEKMAVVGQLAAGVAHEIRNPLNIIGMSAYYLRKVLGAQAGKVREHLEIIQQEITRAQKIIENLLDFSRRSTVRREAVDLNGLIQLTLSLLQKEIQQSDIQLVTEFGAIPPCFANSDDLKQILLNLILNARDSMPNGGSLVVRTRQEGADWVVCELGDTGVGISSEDMPRIFNPFFTTKLDQKGTGLGLAIVRSAIERNNGRVEVQSTVGRGSLFRVKLPTAK